MHAHAAETSLVIFSNTVGEEVFLSSDEAVIPAFIQSLPHGGKKWICEQVLNQRYSLSVSLAAHF